MREEGEEERERGRKRERKSRGKVHIFLYLYIIHYLKLNIKYEYLPEGALDTQLLLLSHTACINMYVNLFQRGCRN